MAIIAIEINKTGFEGECTIPGYVGKIDAIGIREAIEISVPQTPGGTSAAGAGLRGRHADIELTRYHDKASPKLFEACSASLDLGDVRIHLFRTLETGVQVYMSYTLASTYISRIERATLDENGVGLLPNLNTSVRGAPPPASNTGIASLVAPLVTTQTSTTREVVRSAYGLQPGTPTNLEIERVWLDANRITWTYTSFSSGMAAGNTERTVTLRETA